MFLTHGAQNKSTTPSIRAVLFRFGDRAMRTRDLAQNHRITAAILTTDYRRLATGAKVFVAARFGSSTVCLANPDRAASRARPGKRSADRCPVRWYMPSDFDAP